MNSEIITGGIVKNISIVLILKVCGVTRSYLIYQETSGTNWTIYYYLVIVDNSLQNLGTVLLLV